LRSGELYNLRWREVDTTGEAPVLTVVRSKSKRFRVVPLTDVAIRIIDHLRAGSSFDKMDSPIRFNNGYAKLTVAQRGQLLSDITKLTCECFNKTQPGARQYCSACKAIVARYDITYAHAKKLWKNRDKERPTIIWPSDDNKDAFIIPRINIYKSLRKAAAELGITEFHPHQMRHTWATRLLEEGINEFELMQLGGWSTIAMVRRYAKVNVVKLSPKIRKALANRPSGEVRTDLPELRIA
jgi:integrase